MLTKIDENNRNMKPKKTTHSETANMYQSMRNVKRKVPQNKQTKRTIKKPTLFSIESKQRDGIIVAIENNEKKTQKKGFCM